MTHVLSLAAILALCWWLLSGHAAALLLALGAASVAVSVLLARRLGAVDRECLPIHLAPVLLVFWVRLLRDIVVANLQVVRLVLSPRAALSPEILTLPTRLAGTLERVVLANAITLTPGTVTIDLLDGQLVVHALTRASADEVRAGTLEARLAPREGTPP